jgi:monothiol glutaredoxin
VVLGPRLCRTFFRCGAVFGLAALEGGRSGHLAWGMGASYGFDMSRRILEERRVHPSIRDKAFAAAPTVAEVEAAVAQHEIVVVGMKQNPFPRRARSLLDEKGIAYHYLEYGSYLSQWRVRLGLKLWTGWPTFPMIFVRGILIGGFDELQRLLGSGELERLRAGASSAVAEVAAASAAKPN